MTGRGKVSPRGAAQRLHNVPPGLHNVPPRLHNVLFAAQTCGKIVFSTQRLHNVLHNVQRRFSKFFCSTSCTTSCITSCTTSLIRAATWSNGVTQRPYTTSVVQRLHNTVYNVYTTTSFRLGKNTKCFKTYLQAVQVAASCATRRSRATSVRE